MLAPPGEGGCAIHTKAGHQCFAFGTSGVAEEDPGDLSALAIDAEGPILAAGGTTGSADEVVRLRPDGSVDPTWGDAEDGHRARLRVR